LLTDPRMGEELIETLQVYLGSKQNIREAARRLHLAPRTVAYRLERIESLLGETLEGDVTLRLSAALLALRVDRETGGLGPEVTDTDSD
jgi:DNA-binding PucR family transcriptional regulator